MDCRLSKQARYCCITVMVISMLAYLVTVLVAAAFFTGPPHPSNFPFTRLFVVALSGGAIVFGCSITRVLRFHLCEDCDADCEAWSQTLIWGAGYCLGGLCSILDDRYLYACGSHRSSIKQAL